MKMLVKMLYGSHLFGTNTEKSDTDYKGVYLPDIEDCILEKVKRSINKSTGNNGSKNTADDIDTEFYSLQYFIKLATAGETIAIDMLHAPNKFIINKLPAWDLIREQRSRFYTKNLKAFVGFARSQAKKYSIKGDRLDAVEQVYNILCKQKDDLKIGFIFRLIQPGEHIGYTTDKFNELFLEVCGRKFAGNLTVKYVRERIKDIINSYGERAKQAQNASGIDWKAISHAYRVVLEVKEILTTNDIVFPLQNAKYILDIKLGNIQFDKVMNELNEYINEVTELSAKSSFPEQVNVDYWEDFIISLYK
jgi:hypothetical protein